MAVRTTAELVRGIVEVDDTIALDDNSGLDPFIEAANLLVNRVVVPAKNPDGTPYYTDPDELEIIERWLAAHFYRVRDMGVQFEGVKSLMTRFETYVRLNLDLTRYGQNAMVLDTSGSLAQWNKNITKPGSRRKPRLHWGGTPADEDNVI